MITITDNKKALLGKNMQRYAKKKVKWLAGLIVFSILGVQSASAQLSYRSGAEIEPGYEGWRPNDDGTFSLIFGYMNENWEEQPDIEVGDDNFFTPGVTDRGQPTHFLPRRNRFTFEVVVPADWGDRELVWTITHNNETNKAYGTLTTDYLIDNMVIASETGSLGAGTSSPESRANIAPVVSVQGETVNGLIVRNAQVGEEIILMTQVADDGLPKPRGRTVSQTETSIHDRMMRPPRRTNSGGREKLALNPPKSNLGKIPARQQIPLGELFGSLLRSPMMACTRYARRFQNRASIFFGHEVMMEVSFTISTSL